MDLTRLAAAVMLLALAMPAAAAPANLVANGDFSKVTAGKPDQWQAAGDAASVTQTLQAARDADGRPIARLACTRFDARNPASHAMLAQEGVITLVKGRLYEFTCRLRAEGLRGRAVSVAVSDTRSWTNCGLQAGLPVGPTWQTHSRLFYASRDVGPASRLQIWFGETGTLEVADVGLAEVRPQDVEFTDVVPDAGGPNLVRNGSFEVGPSGWSSIGRRVGWGGLVRLYGRLETGGAPHGESYLRIPVGGALAPTLYFDYYQPVVHHETLPAAVSLGWIPLEKGAAYTLSCHLRTGRDGVRAAIGVHARDPAGGSHDYRRTVDLTREWQPYAFTFRTDHRYAFVTIAPAMDPVQETCVDVDAVQLQKGEEPTAFAPRRPVEFSLRPAEPGGLFTAEGPSLVLDACNHADAPARAAVRLEATDYFDQPAPLPEVTFDVPARAAVSRRVPLPASWRGFYRVRATAQAGGAAETADLRLAILPPPAADSVLGINHAFASADLLDLAAKAGVTWYRDWSLKWQHIEPARGEFHWDVADAQILRVLERGLHLTALLPPFPSADWASEAPAGLPTQGYPGVRLRQAWAPKDPADLGRFVGQAVARYKGRVTAWEFLNEPIYTDYSLPADSTNRYGGRKYAPADYVALLAVASAAMKQADPACRVIGGIGSGPLHLTREVLDAGLLKHVDLMDLHFYPGARQPEAFAPEMDRLRALMDAAGGRKPLWITEFAYYGVDDLPRRPFFPARDSWAEDRLLPSERHAAEFTLRFFTVMLARGVERIFIHSGASGQANDPDFECPLFAYGGAPRKMLAALAVFTDLVGPAPALAAERRFGDAGWAVAFEGPGRCVLVLWADDPGAGLRVAVPQADAPRRLDCMGRDLPAGPLALGTSPVYVVGPAGGGKSLLDRAAPVGQ